jgi:peroxiredoxin
MKKIAFIIFSTALLLSCDSHKIDQGTFEITGTIKGLGDESVVLRYRFEGTTYLDTLTAQNDVISFRKEIELPHLVWAMLHYIGENQDLLITHTGFFIDNGIRIVLSGDLNDFSTLNAKNSPYFSEVAKLRDIQRELNLELWTSGRYTSQNAGTLSETELIELRERRNAISQEMEENIQNFIKTGKNSVYAAYLFSTQLFGKTADEVEEIFNQFTQSVQKSAFGEQIRTYMETARRLEPGNPAPNFTQKDINGNIVTLEQFRGQHVMLVFWGSWCGPCRRSHPHLVELAKKYQKEMQLVGFASDKDKDKWKEAIEKDKLDFIHCNLFDKLNDEDVGALYNLKVFPTKVLIDSEGKIMKTVIGAGDEQKKELEDLLRIATGR